MLRSQSNDGKKGKKRTNNNSSSSSTNHSNKVTVTSNNARNQSNHKSSKSNAKNNSNDNNGGGSLSIVGSSGGIGSSNVHQNQSTIEGSHTTTTTQSQSTIVKLSPAPSTGSARTSSPIVNVTIMKKFRDEPSTSRTPDMSFSSSGANNSSSVPSSGGLKFAFEPQGPPQQHHPTPAGLVVNTNAIHHPMKESPPSSPGSHAGSEVSARKRRKGASSATPQPSQPSPHGFHVETKREREEKDSKTSLLQNGAIPVTHHMLGNQLNPASNVAKNMTETLSMEIEAHSIYEPPPNLVGPQYPGRKDSVCSNYA